jgi:NodT family efflux transporter outer membrane factor (OMF) lipoprotein
MAVQRLVKAPAKAIRNPETVMRVLTLVPPLLLLPMLGACVMGPDFRQPPPPASMSKAFVRADQSAAAATPRLSPWWRDLNDPLLDQLITSALSASPTVEAVEARVRQARSQVRGAQAGLAPVLGTGAGAGDVRAPGLVTGGEARSSSVFVTGFDALWEIDLFGGRQRGIEAAQAQLGAAQADAEDARLSLTTEIARRYLMLRAGQQRLDLAKRMLFNQERITELTGQLEQAGKVSRIEREQADRGLEMRRQAIVALEADLADQKDAIAVLAGEAPGTLDAMLDPPAALPLPPAEVAVGDPTTMLARRPDIRAAQQRLRAANAGIGIAEAARMPRISLAGVIGLGGAMKDDVVNADNLFSLAGPTLQWNLADFGRGRASVDGAVARRDEAEAGYRAVVLAALQDAEGSLNRYGAARRTLASATRSALLAGGSSDLADQSWRAGRTAFFVALAAENDRLAAEVIEIQARADLTTCYVALQKALAAGWQDLSDQDAVAIGR